MRRIAMLALAVTLSACSALDSTGPSGDTLEGTFVLRTLNGSRLPYTFSNGLRLISDDLTLYRDGTYTDVSRYDSGQSRTEQGYYTNYNGALTFRSNASNTTYQGSLSRDILTQFVGDYTQVFERE